MNSPLSQFKKYIFKKQIEYGKMRTWMQKKSKSFKQIMSYAQQGDFDANQALLSELKKECNAKEFQKFQNYRKKEEKKYLQNSIRGALKLKDFERAKGMLADAHVRCGEKEYKQLEVMVLKATGPKKGLSAFIQTVSDTFSNLTAVSKAPKQQHDVFKKTEALLEKDVKKVEKKVEKTLPEENVERVANIFGDDSVKSEKDILESILSNPEDEQEEEQEEVSENDLKTYVNPFARYIGWSYIAMMFSGAFLVISWLFFFIQFDESNYVLSMLGQENLVTQNMTLETQLKKLERENDLAQKRIQELREGNIQIPAKIALDEIQVMKIDWIALREDLEEATLQAFPYNDILHYIRYNSFQGDTKNQTLSIVGDIEDPSGRVFARVAKLIQSINSHPSFSGADMRTFAKVENADEEVGGFTSSFNLRLNYYQNPVSEEGTSEQ